MSDETKIEYSGDNYDNRIIFSDEFDDEFDSEFNGDHADNNDGNSVYEDEDGDEDVSSVKEEIISWIKFILGAVVCAFLINSFILFNAYIPTASMENTIMTGDRVLGLRLAYTFGKPHRYDVAIFIFPDSEMPGMKKEYFVKRVIGMPGETLQIKDGLVYINGSETPLPDDFLKAPPFEEDWGPYEIPEGQYFMLGDNRNSSKDSRFWINTFVKEEKILAKAYVCMWPKPRLIK